MLSHSAPLLNANETAFFNGVSENMPVASNTGDNLLAMLGSNGPNMSNPLGNNFLWFDITDGALEGVAITGLNGAGDGTWEYTNYGGNSWTVIPPNVSQANALLLKQGAVLRFLPNERFTGTVGMQFALWDTTDGRAQGSRVDLTLPGATGGTTAFSDTTTLATLDVTPPMPIDPQSTVNSIAAGPLAQAGNLTRQNLFTVGSDGLVREDGYAYSPHSDTGLSVIDPNTKFAVGSALTAYTDGTSVNVFGVALNGQAMWNQWTAAGGWTGFVPLNSLILGASDLFTPGTAVTGAAESNGTLDLFAADSGGLADEFSYKASTNAWTWTNLDIRLTYGTPATPLAVWDSGSSIDLFAVLSGGSVEWLHESGGSWTSSNPLSDGNLAAGTGLAVWDSGGDIFLFGVTTSGNVDEIEDSGGTWGSPTTITAGTYKYASNAALGVEDAGGNFSLFGVNTANAIKNLYYVSGTGWESQGLGGTPFYATTGQAALYVDSSGVIQVFAPTTTGDIAVEQYASSSWNEYTLGRSLAPPTLANSLVPGPVAQAGNLTGQDLFVVGNSFTGGGNTNDGLVRVDTYVYGTHSDSGLSVVDPAAAFAAGTMLTAYSDGTTTNVFAVGKLGNADWAQYTPGRGWTGFVQLNTLIPGESASFAAGAPLTAVAQNGALDLFGSGSDGYVKEYSFNSIAQTWTLANVNSSPLSKLNAGTPLAAWNNGTTIDVFAVLSDDSLEQFQESGGSWTATNVLNDGRLAPATPLAASDFSGTITLFGVTSSGTVDEISNSGGTWQDVGGVISVGASTFVTNQALGLK